MKSGISALLLVGLSVVTLKPVNAQPAQAADAPPPLLVISREEVKPFKGGPHEASEAAWVAAVAKLPSPASMLGMTSLTGPSEAWFLFGYASWEAWEQDGKAMEANAPVLAEVMKLAPLDGDLLTRHSMIAMNYRPAMSYRATSNLAAKRYMQVQIVRVKQGHAREFFDNWREVVAAHEKAKMEEGWAFYQVVSGLPDVTYIYLQAHTSLADIDKAGPLHAAEAYRNAVGEAGRARALEATRTAVESSQTLYFAFNPKLSIVPKAWKDADPYWAPKPPPPPAKPPAKK